MFRRAFASFILFVVAVQPAVAGLNIVRSSGITLTGADGINFIGLSGISLTGPDGLLATRANGITLTGADGSPLTGLDGITLTGADGSTYTGPNGITLTGADGITLTGADGITLTGADGITLTGADGLSYFADSFIFNQPNGITLTGADGITLTGADGITLLGTDGITLTGADGITLTGADGITLTGADSVTGIRADGAVFELIGPTGITLTGADGFAIVEAAGITLTGADGITLTGLDGITSVLGGVTGLLSVDPELARLLNDVTDDSNINAVLVFHNTVTDSDIDQLRQLGILGGTRFRVLPAVYVTATRSQLIAASRLPQVRSLYGNRTLNFNSDPYFNITGLPRAGTDADLRTDNGGLPYTGRNVTVAVLDTGLNAIHPDLHGRVVQNVKLLDLQSLPLGFSYPLPLEDLPNTDLLSGHGTLVGGIIGGRGTASGGKFAGIAPNARLLGLSAGDANLAFILSGLDYLLDRGPSYDVRVVNCSFSAATVYDPNDPVNVATKMLTDRGISVVFSAGNSGPGNGTMNPYAMAPWVISVGATDQNGVLGAYSSRGTFGDRLHHPSLVAPGTSIIGPRSLIGITGITGLIGADLQRLRLSELPYYTTATGTSFSAPQVTGAIALMLEANPELQPAEIKDILSRTATPMPRYFYHEAGAGMLNTHAAVLEAAFPGRHIGDFRSLLSRNRVRFSTRTLQTFEQTVSPGVPAVTNIAIPANTIQATISTSWGLGVADLGLKVFSSSNALLGQSNQLNLPGLTGLREKVVLQDPAEQAVRAEIRHTAGVGTQQSVYGSVVVTQVQYPELADLPALPPDLAAQARRALIANLMLPQGSEFRPFTPVTRAELAETLVRGGGVPQYVAGSPMYADVTDRYTRGSVESVQSNPSGRLIFDVPAQGAFNPHLPASKLVAAVAYVKAAKLDHLAASSYLPLGVSDAWSIPAAWRGYVAVALNRGFITLDGNRVNPSRPITRIELAIAMNRLTDN